MPNTYDRGDTIRVAATFVTSFVPVDPPSVFFYLRNPLGSIATMAYPAASIARVNVGAYYVDVIPSANPANGVWSYRFDSGYAVPGAAAGEGSFIIRITPFL